MPRPTAEAGIRVYFNRAFERRNIENLGRLFEPDRITLADALAHPDRCLMVFRPSMTELDFGGKLPDKSRVLYSYWAGYLTNPDWTQFRQQVAAVGGDFIPAHGSGHIYIADIIEFVKAVNPRLVVPIHSFEPERFRDHFANTHLLADGEPFDIP